jgi:hypothetical protein
MLHYRIHGRILASALPLPELHSAQADGEPTWILTVSDEPAPSPRGCGLLLGEEALPAYGASVALWYSGDGRYRLSYTDTGVFDFQENGRHIRWYRPPAVDIEVARMDILGRVLGLASYLVGDVVLHASGVEIAGRAVAFAAPKFFGKSTLATALADAGARLISDDAIAVRNDTVVQCAPGVPSLRLRRESARHLGRLGSGEVVPDRILEKVSEERVASYVVPLDAVYVLGPRPPATGNGVCVTRTLLGGVESALALVRYSKMGALLGREEGARYLDRATQLATRLPVYVLTYERDFSKLSSVVGKILEWHR